MIRLCQGRKLKYLSLGISINAQFWDFQNNKPKRNCPNKNLINNLISEKEKTFSNQIIEFKSESKDFTVTQLDETVVGGNKIKTASTFLNSEIERSITKAGVNTSIISESLGHSSEQVTQIYLDSFKNSQIDEAMKNLL